MPITQDVQNPDVGELVELFHLDATNLGGEIYRFCSTTISGSAVLWQGQIFSPVPVEADGFERNAQGALPRPRIRVFDVSGVLTGAVIAFGDLVGARFVRHRTLRKYLDGQPTADPAAMLPSEVYLIERKVSMKRGFMEWELSAAMDQEGKKLPARVVLRDLCTHVYRVYDPVLGVFDYSRATCPWTGAGEAPDPEGPYFDSDGNPATVEQDKCNKQLAAGCKVRFGNRTLPFQGFPGAAKVR